MKPVPKAVFDKIERNDREHILNCLQADIMSGLMDNMSLKNMIRFRAGNYGWRKRVASS